jgi:hypothetical protein
MKEMTTLSKRSLKSGKELYRIPWWQNGKKRSETLGHCDRRWAERVLAEKFVSWKRVPHACQFDSVVSSS